MGWKFWAKTDAGNEAPKSSRHSRPRELPQAAGRHLVVNRGLEPDWVWSLRCVLRPATGDPGAFDIRIFDPQAASESGAAIRDFSGLDALPDLILFEGTYDREAESVRLEKKESSPVGA